MTVFQAMLVELHNLEEAAKKTKDTSNMNMRQFPADSEAEIPVRRLGKYRLICTDFF